MMPSYFRKTGKRICVLFFAALILILTPACDYLDAKHMKTVDAASIAAGVTAAGVLKLIAGAFGVVITAGALSKAVDSFDEWVHSEGVQDAIDNWEQAQEEAISYQVDNSLAASVRSWLLSKFDSLDSGEVSVVTGDGVVTNGVASLFPDGEQSLLENFTRRVSDERQYFYFSNYYNSSYSCFPVFSDYMKNTEDFGYFVVFTDVSCCIFSVRNVSGKISEFYYPELIFRFNFNTYGHDDIGASSTFSTPVFSALSFDGICHDPSQPSGPYRIVTNLPLIITDLDTLPSSGDSISDVLAHALTTYNMDGPDIFASSYGSYDETVLPGLIGFQLNAAMIAGINAAVDQAAADHTSTDDDGNLVYAPDISQAIIDAYKQGLEDAGGTIPVDPDQPDDPDRPVVTPDDGILGFLQGLKSSLENWITAIPDAIATHAGSILNSLETGWTTLWGHLSGIGDTLTSGFAQVIQGITDIPGTFEGLFSDLHDWIMDIPTTITDSFTLLHEWIMDIPVPITEALEAIKGVVTDIAGAIPGAEEIAAPITDAIEDTFTVDPDAVQEAIEAEKAELWDLPFLIQAKDLFDGFHFSSVITYPKIKITTPEILRPYYDQPEIILLDFEDYKDYCLWARLLFRATIWLAFVWHVVDLATPKLRIS